MASIILFDDEKRDDLLPLVFTKPCAELRVGIFRIFEKWEQLTNLPTSFLATKYLASVFPYSYKEDNLYVNGRMLPDNNIAGSILSLEENQALYQNKTLLACRTSKELPHSFFSGTEWNGSKINYAKEISFLEAPHSIFQKNGSEIRKDIERLKLGKEDSNIDASNRIIGDHLVYIHPTAKVYCAILNASNGPIYIGENAEVMEGSIIRGPFALCNNAVVKMGAKMYGDSTIGPHSKVGGEISNSVIQGFSNKGHDGYLGNSVLGEWCNLGADTNTSNLKNNYSQVKVWSYSKGDFQNTGQQFHGLIMGDHSKCGINTMFNTGTIVGVCANIFGGGFPPKFIPSFSWGGSEGFVPFRFEKAIEVAERVMARRNKELSKEAILMLKEILNSTEAYRDKE